MRRLKKDRGRLIGRMVMQESPVNLKFKKGNIMKTGEQVLAEAFSIPKILSKLAIT